MSPKVHPLTRVLATQLLAVGPPEWPGRLSENVQAKVDDDDRLLEEMLTGASSDAVQRIWTNGACLVATRKQASHPHFQEAVAATGLPVAVRRSAGTTVIHHGGTLQLSLALGGNELSIEQGYLQLADILTLALARLGVTAMLGAVAGSYCNGVYNVVANNRKLAGTAAFTRSRRGRTAAVYHAVISVAGNITDDVERIERFETSVGQPSCYDPAAHCTLEELLFETASAPQSSHYSSV